jgi:hypothetical protein
MRAVERSHPQTKTIQTSSQVLSGLILLSLVALLSSPQVTAQSGAAQSGAAQAGRRINGKYSGRIEASADAGVVFNLFMGDRDFDFRTEIQLNEDDAGRVTGSAQFVDQKNRRSEGSPSGQRTGSRLRFAIPLRENCGPILTKAVVSAEGDVLQFPGGSQTVTCSGSGISVGVRIRLKAFTLAR